jgi:hypothetical protein
MDITHCCLKTIRSSRSKNHAGGTSGRVSTPDLISPTCLDLPHAQKRDSDDAMKCVSNHDEVRHSNLPDCNTERLGEGSMYMREGGWFVFI